MSAIEEADALHARVRDAIAGKPFVYEELARAIASFQARNHPGYARLCRARGVDPSKDPPSSLPAVPTDAFRLTRVATFPEALEKAVFRTSGTTVGTRGAHAMRTLATYHDASTAFARSTLFAPYSSPPTIVAVAPSFEEAPDSSLGRMLAWFVEELGAPGSRFVSPTAIDDAIATLESVTGPVVLLATAFAHVFLLDRLAGRTLPLAAGSRAMQTGGFKGRSREVAAEVLRSQIARAWGLDEASVVGEYGMTELTSQLWATPEVGSTRDRWLYAAPSWVRVTACDPITLAARPTGERGIARIEDLANVESAWAIQTADEVVVDARGHVELFGRLAGSTPRGCSLAIEELAE